MNKSVENPFCFGRLVGGSFFTDRENDTKRLAANFKNSLNTILISPRRWGKSSLVKKTGEIVKNQNIKVAYLDTFACRNELDFYTIYTKEILKATSSQWEEVVQLIKDFLKHISPKITFGKDFSIQFDWREAQQHADDILNLPDKIAKAKGFKMVICIDEFQNIANFNDSLAFQKHLRSIWQKHDAVCYCIYGSKFHMMQELFERQSMPFYRFGDLIHLDKISEKDWLIFIHEQFQKTGKIIDNTFAEQIVKIVDRHSYYVQQLSHLIWERTEDAVNEYIFNEALEDMIAQNAMLYQRDTENMSATQLNFMKAIASGERKNLSSKNTINNYHLGTSANVLKIKKYLFKNEIIDIRNKEVTFIDPVYELWFKKEILEINDSHFTN